MKAILHRGRKNGKKCKNKLTMIDNNYIINSVNIKNKINRKDENMKTHITNERKEREKMRGKVCAMVICGMSDAQACHAYTMLNNHFFKGEFENRRTMKSEYAERITQELEECEMELLDFIYQLLVKCKKATTQTTT